MSIHVFGKMKYIGDLSLESINSDIEKNNYDVPIYGDFATSVAKKLNDMYAKDGKEEMVESLGRDLNGSSADFNYKLGRNDVVTGIADTPAVVHDTHLSVESVNPMGVGIYNIIHEVAGLAKGVPHPVIFTMEHHLVKDEDVELIKDLIVRGNKHVILILFIHGNLGVDQVRIGAPALYELMESTNHLTVYLTYKVEQR